MVTNRITRKSFSTVTLIALICFALVQYNNCSQRFDLVSVGNPKPKPRPGIWNILNSTCAKLESCGGGSGSSAVACVSDFERMPGLAKTFNSSMDEKASFLDLYRSEQTGASILNLEKVEKCEGTIQVGSCQSPEFQMLRGKRSADITLPEVNRIFQARVDCQNTYVSDFGYSMVTLGLGPPLRPNIIYQTPDIIAGAEDGLAENELAVLTGAKSDTVQRYQLNNNSFNQSGQITLQSSRDSLYGGFQWAGFPGAILSLTNLNFEFGINRLDGTNLLSARLPTSINGLNGATHGDLDGDGNQDLLLWGNSPPQIYRHLIGGIWNPVNVTLRGVDQIVWVGLAGDKKTILAAPTSGGLVRFEGWSADPLLSVIPNTSSFKLYSPAIRIANSVDFSGEILIVTDQGDGNIKVIKDPTLNSARNVFSGKVGNLPTGVGFGTSGNAKKETIFVMSFTDQAIYLVTDLSKPESISKSQIRLPFSPREMLVRDLNKDGRSDLIVSSADGHEIVVYLSE